MIAGHLHRRLGNDRSHARVLPLLRIRLRGHQQMPVRHLLPRLAPLYAQQVERIEGCIVDRRQGTSAGHLPPLRILPVLLVLVVRQHGEQEEGRLPRRHQNAIVLEVVALPVGRRDELHVSRIRYLHILRAV